MLTLALTACGGGNTAGPVAQSSVVTAPPPPPPAPTQASGAPPAKATAPAPPRTTTTPVPRPAAPPAAARPSGGSAAPTDDGSLGDAPPLAGDEPAPPAAASEPITPIDERASLVLTRRVTNTHYFQQGTVTGTYDGTMETEARITSRGVLVRFTATLPGGTISGRAVAVAILDSTTWPGLRGRAIITGGTGRFAGIQARRLRVTGRSKPDASRTRVRLVGTTRLG